MRANHSTLAEIVAEVVSGSTVYEPGMNHSGRQNRTYVCTVLAWYSREKHQQHLFDHSWRAKRMIFEVY